MPRTRLTTIALLLLAATAARAQYSFTFSSSDQVDPASAYDVTGSSVTFDFGAFTNTATNAVISGNGSVIANGTTGQLIFWRNNSYSGGTFINGGTLVGDATDSFGTGTITLAANTDSAVLFDRYLVNSLTVANNFVVEAGTGTATIGSTNLANPSSYGYFAYTGTLELNRATTLLDAGTDNQGRTTFSGVISGNVGTLSIQGGRVTLEAANTFTGDVVVKNNSLLQLSTAVTDDSGPQIIPIASSVTLQGSGVLHLFGDSRVGSLIGGSASSVTTYEGHDYQLTVGANNQSTTFDGALLSIRLKKVGTGTLTLTNTGNTHELTTIAEGTLALGAANALGNSRVILSGGTLDLGGFSHAVDNTLEVTAASFIDFTGTSSLTFASSSSVNWTGTLTLLNYQAGVDSLRFGTDATGLTSTQLALISVAGYTVNGLDSSGALSLTASAIPEPSTYAALLGAASLGLVIHRRRRQRISLATARIL